jgi:hypothetical protein
VSPGAPAEPDQHTPGELPHSGDPQAPPPHEPPPNEPPVTKRRSPLKILVIALLILVPTGYGAVAAVQSRQSDGDKHTKAALSGLVHSRPSRLQRRIYKVPLPANATGVGYFESNSWQTSSLYVQFTTTGAGLDAFLRQLGTSRSALRDGNVPVSAAQAARVRWTFAPAHHWAGLTLTGTGTGTALTHRITVDLDHPDRPSVYVVSTTDFR